MKRELELLKARFANSSASSTQRTPEARTSAETRWVNNQVSLNVIAELLPEFDGTMGDFRMWRNKLKILEQTYQLNDNHMKILVRLRLRGKALAWLHSADEYMLLSSEELLKGLGAMFDRQVDSMVLHEKFRARKWRKDESFSDYMKQMLGYIINGIPHWGLRTKIRVSGVSTKKELRARLENVEHWDTKNEAERDTGRYKTGLREQNNEVETSNTGGRGEQKKRKLLQLRTAQSR